MVVLPIIGIWEFKTLIREIRRDLEKSAAITIRPKPTDRMAIQTASTGRMFPQMTRGLGFGENIESTEILQVWPTDRD